MHEVKSDRLAERKQEEEEDGTNSRSIQATELGESVLTLHEVVQNFEEESVMFNMKIQKREKVSQTCSQQGQTCSQQV